MRSPWCGSTAPDRRHRPADDRADAQLSTVAGIRAPLSRIADEVFLSLSRELESQGVTRKVAADMFGLALRSYQLKINRLTASARVLDFLERP